MEHQGAVNPLQLAQQGLGGGGDGNALHGHGGGSSSLA
jgi:hypothetical protein